MFPNPSSLLHLMLNITELLDPMLFILIPLKHSIESQNTKTMPTY